MEVLSNNIANVDTTGFKPDLVIAQSQGTQVTQRGSSLSRGANGFSELGSGVSLAGTATSFAPGSLKVTGRNLDFALKGDGFFTVERDGEKLLTRAGDFSMTPSGLLTTVHGDPVLDSSGGPITLNPNESFRLTETGQIQQAGGSIELGIVKPQSLGDLVKVGSNLFRPLAEVQPLAAGDRMTTQGYLEASGMNPVSGMMEMVTASRAFEANIHMIQNQDHIAGTLINRVLSSNGQG